MRTVNGAMPIVRSYFVVQRSFPKHESVCINCWINQLTSTYHLVTDTWNAEDGVQAKCHNSKLVAAGLADTVSWAGKEIFYAVAVYLKLSFDRLVRCGNEQRVGSTKFVRICLVVAVDSGCLEVSGLELEL